MSISVVAPNHRELLLPLRFRVFAGASELMHATVTPLRLGSFELRSREWLRLEMRVVS